MFCSKSRLGSKEIVSELIFKFYFWLLGALDIYAWWRVQLYVNTHMHTCSHTCPHAYAGACSCPHTCTPTCMYTRMHLILHVYIFSNMTSQCKYTHTPVILCFLLAILFSGSRFPQGKWVSFNFFIRLIIVVLQLLSHVRLFATG